MAVLCRRAVIEDVGRSQVDAMRPESVTLLVSKIAPWIMLTVCVSGPVFSESFPSCLCLAAQTEHLCRSYGATPAEMDAGRG